MDIFIYGLVDPRDERIYYIGQSKDPDNRLKQHLREKGHTPKVEWLQELSENGKEPELEILEVSNINEWVEREKYWIQKGLDESWPLTNLSNGGEGRTDASINCILSDYFKTFNIDIDTDAILTILGRDEKWNLICRMAQASEPHLWGLCNEFQLRCCPDEYEGNGIYFNENHCNNDIEYSVYEYWALINQADQ